MIACVLIAACGGSDGASAAEAAKHGVRLAKIGSFDTPVYVTSPPGDRRLLFVVEQHGRIRVLRDGKLLDHAFLDLRGHVTCCGEQGMLSLAFAPDYARSGLFYVYYTDSDANQRIVEYRRADATHADAGSARLVLEMDDHESNHNGGLMIFGPDKRLYVGTGDGGGGGDEHGPIGNAQSLGSLLGKILRIDPRRQAGAPYGVPADNPFAGRSDARGEIFSYGLRNPWRLSIDAKTREMLIGDVGQDQWEEINAVPLRVARGANFGWRVLEGRSTYQEGESASRAIGPVIVRSHDKGNCSIIGGVIVRDARVRALKGRYLFGDYCTGRIESAKVSGRRVRGVRSTGLKVQALDSFGLDGRGRVYVVSNAGPVYRLTSR
jgi:glucose/arabinose dehydrogenase